MRHFTVPARLRFALGATLSRVFDRVFGKRDRRLPRAAPAGTERKEVRGPSSQSSAVASQKDALRIALGETLLRNGIPASWISMDTLRSVHATGTPGIHLRIKVHRWDERLVACMVALEHDFLRRLSVLDAHRTEWLRDVSWQFALGDASACPPLPHPGSWTAYPRPERREPARAARSEARVITGPVLIREVPGREDLARLLAVRDAEFEKQHGGGPHDYLKTVPIDLMPRP
jgi:hypothetical protein